MLMVQIIQTWLLVLVSFADNDSTTCHLCLFFRALQERSGSEEFLYHYSAWRRKRVKGHYYCHRRLEQPL